MQGLPENLPIPTNSFVVFVVLGLFILGGMASRSSCKSGKRSGAVSKLAV
jgi:hypothetical protein